MAKYFRFDTPDPDEYVQHNIIAMLTKAPDIKTRLYGKDGIRRTFELILMQEEKQSVLVRYISEKPETELKLIKLFKSEGTLIVMNNCFITRTQPLQMEVTIDDDLCILACRPNAYQIDKFMKVSFVSLKKSDIEKLKSENKFVGY